MALIWEVITLIMGDCVPEIASIFCKMEKFGKRSTLKSLSVLVTSFASVLYLSSSLASLFFPANNVVCSVLLYYLRLAVGVGPVILLV